MTEQSKPIETNYSKAMDILLNNDQVKAGLNFLKLDNNETLKDQIELTAIPAPTFSEQVRGDYYKKRLTALGLKNIKIDSTGNVLGLRPGSGNGPTLVVSAHLDTVFPEGTDVTAKIQGTKVYAPGISDDGRGLAVLLTLIRAFNETQIETEGDILFVATVGEEGLGDLRGVKALFDENKRIDGFISVEPGSPTKATYLGTGSRRYKITYTGPGGHSFGNFGTTSAIHALGRAVAMIANIETPSDPKTTFNVGLITGGTSINTIAAEASMLLDMRSTSSKALEKLENQVMYILKQAAEDENKHWGQNAIQMNIELVGDRPAGSQAETSPTVQASLVAMNALGFAAELDGPSSTDSNVPISLGIPSVTLGGGGDCGGAHTLEEYFDPTDAYYGPQQVFLTILGLVGISGVSKPFLIK